MALPDYFNQFPELEYLTGINNAGIGTFTKTVNLFRTANLKETVFKYATFYYDYVIQNGEKPEDVARKEYDNDGLYWLVLQINNIVDPYQQWPLSDEDLDNYILNKYGSWAAAESISHYETLETKNTAGDVVLPAGLRVASDYIFYYHPDPHNKVEDDGEWVLLSSLPIPVSYAEQERRDNDKKKTISLLDRKYIPDYIRELRRYLGVLDTKKSDVDLSKFLT
jgi:hypothetical protein